MVRGVSNTGRANGGWIANGIGGMLFGDKVDVPWERKQISLDSKQLDRYVGTYQADQMTITVTNENGHLMVEPKGQRKIEALPSSETEFFVKEVDAKLVFSLGADGKATEVRLGQGDMVAKRGNRDRAC